MAPPISPKKFDDLGESQLGDRFNFLCEFHGRFQHTDRSVEMMNIAQGISK
jgi:hypothetical protein